MKQQNSNKIVVVAIGLLAGLILACVAYSFHIKNDVRNEAMQEMLALLEQGSKSVTDRVEENNEFLRATAAFVAKRQYVDDEQVVAYLKNYSDYKSFARIGVTDREGNAITSDGQRFKVSEKATFKQNIAGEAFISNPFVDPITGRPVLVFGVPLTANGEIVGTASMIKEVSKLEDEFLYDFYGGNGYCHIVDNNGEIVLHSKNENSDQMYKNLFTRIASSAQSARTAEALVEKIRGDLNQGRNGVVQCNLGGIDKYIGYASLQGATKEWNLICLIDAQVIDERSQKIMTKTFVLCAAVVLLMAVLLTYLIYLRDRSQKGIEKLAFEDAMTGLLNTNGFCRRAAALIRKQSPGTYAMVCVDIRKFRYINESHGYEAGDEVLLSLSEEMHKAFFGEEACARINGDRFAVLYKIDDAKLTRYYKMLENLNAKQNRKELKIPLHFSTGIYIVHDRDETVMSMLDKATLALKSIREQTAFSHIYYCEELLQGFMREKEIENKMREALTRQEFKVYLQPKYDLKEHRIAGAEALVRWVSPQEGIISPDAFIPVFEKNGFVVELDFYVLEEVCKKIRTWIDAGDEPFRISVNQSRFHLNNPYYLERISALLEKYRIPPQLIELELTESMFFDKEEKIIAILDQMHELGVLLSMDDFGSGYSSLNLLKAIPVDILKIDKSFLDEADDSERSRIIVSQVVEMARKLGMKVVCEGVETERQVEFLSEIHCDMAQGFLYARPMPMEDFDRFCADQNEKHT